MDSASCKDSTNEDGSGNYMNEDKQNGNSNEDEDLDEVEDWEMIFSECTRTIVEHTSNGCELPLKFPHIPSTREIMVWVERSGEEFTKLSDQLDAYFKQVEQAACHIASTNNMVNESRIFRERITRKQSEIRKYLEQMATWAAERHALKNGMNTEANQMIPLEESPAKRVATKENDRDDKISSSTDEFIAEATDDSNVTASSADTSYVLHDPNYVVVSMQEDENAA